MLINYWKKVNILECIFLHQSEICTLDTFPSLGRSPVDHALRVFFNIFCHDLQDHKEIISWISLLIFFFMKENNRKGLTVQWVVCCLFSSRKGHQFMTLRKIIVKLRPSVSLWQIAFWISWICHTSVFLKDQGVYYNSKYVNFIS